MLSLPVLRWGKPYESLEKDTVVHFNTGEPMAEVHQANAGLLQRDMRKAKNAREALRQFSCAELIEKVKKAADLYVSETLPMGNGTQSPDEFVRMQSASTGLPEHMCRFNMTKNQFVLQNMDRMLDALTRGLDLDILSRGYGVESRGVVVSYQAQASALALVLPSNSPGVHTLWLPVIPMQVGLVLKPGPQEPWTPYRMTAAFTAAGIPEEAISIYPGGADIGAAVLASVDRALIFGGTPTVDRYRGNPKVQAHGPGFSKFILADDVVDDWEQYLDIIADSIYRNSGRGCINCSGVWASRHTKEIAQALAERLGPIEPLPPEDENAGLAAFTAVINGKNMGRLVWDMIEADLKEDGVTHATEPYGPRLVEEERCAYLRPTIVHCTSPEQAIAKKEYMFPFSTVVECPQDKMLESIGPTLVCSAITNDEALQQQLTDATHIDRLNIGPIPTIKLDWLQPHEGSIVDFLFRARAYQVTEEKLAALKA
ncbi:MAG: aldehyde dehydrogenase family protein [Pirellulales bacterium]|nr:aldehyde dehydrogenase family protein [Pirellulales bacterium]